MAKFSPYYRHTHSHMQDCQQYYFFWYYHRAAIFSAVSISGSNLFGHATSINSITFGGVEADVDSTNSNNSIIRVRVQPNDVAVNTPVQVVITAATMARVSTSGQDWTYLVPGAVSGVEPDTGQAGTVVTITGERAPQFINKGRGNLELSYEPDRFFLCET